MEQKLYFLENNWQKTIQQQHDILLFEAKGRYLYFKIEILQYAGNQVSISNLKIDFPRQNMAKYLPSFYDSNHKNNSFLKMSTNRLYRATVPQTTSKSALLSWLQAFFTT